ncbi:MAG: SnoaL-like domain-containing protein [Hamadaea sp.]|nr:SnoaL-like domain-containing protein [Hamadaea sp.]
MDDAVQAHAALFNASVRRGDWAEFTATFTDDAVMRFVNVPAGPYEGRAAIAEAYAQRPPDDTMTLTAVEEIAPDTAEVAFAWDRGGRGSMRVVWREGLVADLTITFG